MSRPGQPSRGRGGPGGRGAQRSPARQGPPPRIRRVGSGLGGDVVEGRRAVIELLRGQRQVRNVVMGLELESSPQLDEIERLCAKRNVPIELVGKGRLESTATTESHQGVVAFAKAVTPVDLEQLLKGKRTPFLLIPAGVTDPRNLGSMLRSAEGAGVTGVILARHRAAHLSPTVCKVAAGAVEHLRFTEVGGIPAAIEQLSKMGVTTIGLAGEAKQSLYDLPLGHGPVAIVVGGEEKGLPPLVQRRCTASVSLPQLGKVESLNAGVAAGIALYEVARQRLVAG